MGRSESGSLENLPISVLEEIDQRCEEFEATWVRGERPRVWEFVESAPALGQRALLRELLLLDVEYRRKLGEFPLRDEYATDMSQHSELLEDAWQAAFITQADHADLAPRPELNEFSTAPLIDAHLMGRYEIRQEIARGGMGVVLWARDRQLGRDLAVKVLKEKHQHHPEVVRRFLEEGRIAGHLQHPGIPPIFELGCTPNALPYIAMKLVDGRTLAALLAVRADPRQDRQRFLAVFENVCQTLAYVHSRGVLHRDLKPANIMVGAFGEVQIMDWGLAKRLRREHVVENNSTFAARQLVPPTAAFALDQAPGDDPAAGTLANRNDALATCDSASLLADEIPANNDQHDSHRTRHGLVLGTPAYMAPEQALGQGDLIDERVDVFGLGALLCEILTGHPPYRATDGVELIEQARHGNLEDAFRRLDDCLADRELVELARSCLAVDRDARPHDASIVARAITQYQRGVQDRLRYAEMGAMEARTAAALERKTRQVIVTVALAIAMILLMGASGWIWFQQNHQQRIADQNRQLTSMLDEVRRLRERAMAGPTEDLAPWSEADAVARQTLDFARSNQVDAGLAREAQSAAEELARATGDRRLLAELNQIRLGRAASALNGQQNDQQVAERMARAFATWGLQRERLSQQDAINLLTQPREPWLRDAILVALDDWMQFLPADHDERQWLVEITQAADADDWRDRLRRAVAQQDFAAAYRVLGSRLMAAGKNQEALAAYRQGLLFQPDSAATQRDFGLTAASLGFHEEAVGALGKAIELDPRNADACRDLGHAWRVANQLEKAVEAYRKALAITPEDFATQMQLGNCLARLRNWDDAALAYSAVVRLHGNAMIGEKLAHWRAYAVLSLHRGDPTTYQLCRQNLLQLLDSNSSDFHTEPAVRSCLLLPLSGDDPALVIADRLGRMPQNVDREMMLITSALGAFRRGQFGVVSNRLSPWEPSRPAPGQRAISVLPHSKSSALPFASLILAMAKYQQGQTSVARQLLREAAPRCHAEVRDSERVAAWECQILLREAESMIELEPRLENIDHQQATLSDRENIELAEQCARGQRFWRRAAELYTAAFAQSGRWVNDRAACHRWQAAACAAMAGCGFDPQPVTDPQRYRMQALDWLRAELSYRRAAIRYGAPAAKNTNILLLSRWLKDARFLGVREPAKLQQLSPREQLSWTEFWDEVRLLVQ